MSLVNSEDVKLLTLAQAALKRNAHEQCAALRDSTGRTHVGSSVALTSLQLDALQVALAMALSSGADAIEAAVVVGREPHSQAVANIREVSTRALIWFASTDGSVTPL